MRVPKNYIQYYNIKFNRDPQITGEYFQLSLIDYGDVGRDEKDPVFTIVALKEIKADDPNAIFLVDHALTFKSDILRKQLVENPSIVNRLSIMMGLPTNDDVETVMQNIWRFSNFYSINGKIVRNCSNSHD